MSLQLRPLGSFLPLLLVGSLFFHAVRATAQTADSQRARDKPGLALVKPQPWSSEDQATVLEFLAFSDHSGYFEFRTAKTPNTQVATSRIVKLVVYPESPQSLTTAEQRDGLQKIVEDFAALSAKIPRAARQLDNASAQLKADVAKYDAGNVKDGGQWILRSAFYKQKAMDLADLLRPELTAAPRIKEVDLDMNQYYLGLLELAKAEPSVGGVVEGIRSLYQSLGRKADRDALLSRINSPTLSFDQAADLVKQLKALQPGEDARANLFLQSWDSAVANAGKLTKQITDARTQFEGAMPPAEDPGKVPAIPTDISSNLEALSSAVRAFRSGSPPPAILVPLQLADAMKACGETLPSLAKQIQARELLDAKAALDPLSNQADIIGPKTAQALSSLRKKLAAEIEKFQTLRNEGKMLAENDKIEEALKKYQQAYAIIPAKDVAAQIALLKKQ